MVISPAFGCFGGGACCCPIAQPRCGCATICATGYSSTSYVAPSYAAAPQAIPLPQSYAVAAPSYSYAPVAQQYVGYQSPVYQNPPPVYSQRAVSGLHGCMSPHCGRHAQVAAVVQPEPTTFVKPPMRATFVHPAPSAVVETIPSAASNDAEASIDSQSESVPAPAVEPGDDAPTEVTVVETDLPKSEGESYQIEVAPPPIQEETFVDSNGNAYRRVHYFQKILRSRF